MMFLSTGTVGPPLVCCAIKLVDIPEMEYYAKDNKGEVGGHFICIIFCLVFIVAKVS
jgi:hypothetical protein